MLRLVNRYEEIAHGEIKVAVDRWDLSVYPKVRVADVISLDEVGAISGIHQSEASSQRRSPRTRLVRVTSRTRSRR
jgi:hypothetical protein